MRYSIMEAPEGGGILKEISPQPFDTSLSVCWYMLYNQRFSNFQKTLLRFLQILPRLSA